MFGIKATKSNIYIYWGDRCIKGDQKPVTFNYKVVIFPSVLT